MATRVGIIGLDSHQREWLDALVALRLADEIEIVGIGHRNAAAARDTAEVIKALGAPSGHAAVPAYDDLRVLVQEKSPQVLVIDRPANATMDFLLGCVESDIALFSLGPPVETFAEAQALAEALGPRSRKLYIFPHFAESQTLRQCAQAEEFIRPIRFASATWLGLNHALLRGREASHQPPQDLPVRSLSVLAWDALSTLVRLMGVPTTVYTAIRGTMGTGNSFADLSGAASITLRFADDSVATLSLCDHMPVGARSTRQLLLWGTTGTLRIDQLSYTYHDAEGQLIDRGERGLNSPASEAAEALHAFLSQATLPPSPHLGWELHLTDLAAVMEALVVSQRTGEPESPEHFRHLRR